MTPEERNALLEAFAQLGRHSDAAALDPLTTFLPLAAHRRALRPEAVVLLGSRGTGKTALFRLVNDPRTASRLRSFFEDDRIPEATWFDAFSSADQHPEVGTLEAFAASAADIRLRAFWMTHLLRRLREVVPEVVQVPPEIESLLAAPAADVGAWVPIAEANLGAINAALDAVNRTLVAADRYVVATYDTLDRIGQFDREIRRRYLSTLLALWLSLSSRYQRLRGKLFLRDDLFDAGELRFPDANKLRSSSETLTWEPVALLRVTVRHLAAESEAARGWLREVPGLELVDRGEFGWMPGDMKSPEVQRAFVARFAGKVIGRGVVKGSTAEWIMGRLRDAHKRITPRAMLWFFAFAAEEALQAPPRRKGPLVGSSDLLAAVRRTSQQRVQELLEEYPLVIRMENLRGMTLWISREMALERLGKPRPDETADIPARGDVILAELLRLGVLRERAEGEIDVPDIYRYAFEITPDYTDAWRDLLVGDEARAREQFTRELPILGEILGKLAAPPETITGANDEGDLDNARARNERALGLARDAGNVSLQADLLSRLGKISTTQGRFGQAVEELTQSVEFIRRMSDPRKLGALLWELAYAELQTGDTASAASHFREGVAVNQQAQDPYSQAGCGAFLSPLLLQQGRLQEARSAFDETQRLLNELPEHSKMTINWVVLASMGTRQLVHNQFRQALMLFAAAAAIAKVSDPIRGMKMTSTRDDVAELLQLAPEDRLSLYKAAEELYERDHGWSLLLATLTDER